MTENDIGRALKLLNEKEFESVLAVMVVADRQLLALAVHSVLWDEKLNRRSDEAMADEIRKLPIALRRLEARRLTEMTS